MDQLNMDSANIKATFSQPVLPRSVATPVQVRPSSPQPPATQAYRFDAPTPAVRPLDAVRHPAPAKQGWSLVDFSKTGIIKDDKIYDKNFRFKTRDALKGTLKHYADRETVANLLWDKRGYGGITKDEVKYGLRKLEKQGKLTFDQVKAVRRKLHNY